MCFQQTQPLDDVASRCGIATGSLQLQSKALAFVGIQPGEKLTLQELQSACWPSAGATAVSPIVVRPAPSAGEREPCSTKLTP